MHQRFKVRNSHPWLPVLIVFGTVLYASVEVADRGLGAVSIWFVIPLLAIAFFLFRSRNSYVELADGHLTWLAGGHLVRKVAFSEISHVQRSDRVVNIFVPSQPPRRTVFPFPTSTQAG